MFSNKSLIIIICSNNILKLVKYDIKQLINNISKTKLIRSNKNNKRIN